MGIQTNPKFVVAKAKWLGHRWAPPKAKSFSFSIQHTDYHGAASNHETGYANAKIRYFTTTSEGEHRVDRSVELPPERIN